jgi:hypothetical protein
MGQQPERRRGIRWSTVERVVKLLVSVAGEVVKLIDALRGGR